MESNDLAWAAGFYEGEGSCGVWGKLRWNEKAKRWIKPQLRVDVVQKEPEPLYKLREIFGYGSVLRDKYNVVYHYRTSAKLAKHFLESILPFIINPRKIEQANGAIQKYKESINRNDITGHGGTCGV